MTDKQPHDSKFFMHCIYNYNMMNNRSREPGGYLHYYSQGGRGHGGGALLYDHITYNKRDFDFSRQPTSLDDGSGRGYGIFTVPLTDVTWMGSCNMYGLGFGSLNGDKDVSAQYECYGSRPGLNCATSLIKGKYENSTFSLFQIFELIIDEVHA